jgi:uncharacterized membrane protein
MVNNEAEWSLFVGILIFVIAIVLAITLYLRYKKISQIVFLTSISTYIFAVFYTWDVFDLNKNWVIGLLFFSTILMLALGKYFSSSEFKKDKVHTSLKEKN